VMRRGDLPGIFPPCQGACVNITLRITRLAVCVLAVGLLSLAHAAAAPSGVADGSADAQFKHIYSAEWAWRTGHRAAGAAAASPDNSRLDDMGAASQQKRLDYW